VKAKRLVASVVVDERCEAVGIISSQSESFRRTVRGVVVVIRRDDCALRV